MILKTLYKRTNWDLLIGKKKKLKIIHKNILFAHSIKEYKCPKWTSNIRPREYNYLCCCQVPPIYLPWWWNKVERLVGDGGRPTVFDWGCEVGKGEREPHLVRFRQKQEWQKKTNNIFNKQEWQKKYYI